MSRYIDADALKEWLDEYLSVFKKYDKGTIKGFVDHAPSIDIVRCVECRYKGMEICPMYKLTKAGVLKPYDFCSYGERKDNGKDIQSATE